MPIVLIVDDEPSHRMLLREALADTLALEFVELENGMQALGVARQVRPDLVILDVNLPILDGLQVCRRLKYDPELRSIPVIVVAADPCEPEARAAGCDAYFLKPFKVGDFAATALGLIKSSPDS
jgi:CheY-like chemotaxis protein